jgi:hypothetical protein
MEVDAILAKASSEKDFRAVFDSAVVNASTPDCIPFMSREVAKGFTGSRTWKVDVGYVASDEFEKFLKCTPSQASVRTTTAFNLRAEPYEAVPMAPHTIPAWLPFVLGSVSIKEFISLNEVFMSSNDQLRDGQAMDTFSFLVRQEEETSRGKDLRAEAILALPQFDYIKAKAERFNEARSDRQASVQAQMEALRGGVAAPAEVVQRASRFANIGSACAVKCESAVPSIAAASSKQYPSSGRGGRSRSTPFGRGGGVNRQRGPLPTIAKTQAAAIKSRGAAPVLNGSSFVSPVGRPRLAVPLGFASPPLQPLVEGASKRARIGRYQPKSIELGEIFDGTAPGRQVGPVPREGWK